MIGLLCKLNDYFCRARHGYRKAKVVKIKYCASCFLKMTLTDHIAGAG